MAGRHTEDGISGVAERGAEEVEGGAGPTRAEEGIGRHCGSQRVVGQESRESLQEEGAAVGVAVARAGGAPGGHTGCN